jgi:hypothetical protein
MTEVEAKDTQKRERRLVPRRSVESYQARAEQLAQRADERLKKAFEILQQATSE